jgi:hypothetical protein
MPYDPSTDSRCVSLWDAGSLSGNDIVDSKGSHNLVATGSGVTHIAMPSGRWSGVNCVQLDFNSTPSMQATGLSINSQSFTLAGVLEVSTLIASNPGVIIGLGNENFALYIGASISDYLLLNGLSGGSTTIVCPSLLEIVIVGDTGGAKLIIEGITYTYSAIGAATWGGLQLFSWPTRFPVLGGGICGSWLLYNVALTGTDIDNARQWTRSKAGITANPAQALFVIGDSIPAGKGPVSQQSYMHLATLPADTRVYNLSIPGNNLSTFVSNQSQYISTINATIAQVGYTKAAVVIHAGTNDITGGANGATVAAQYSGFHTGLKGGVTGLKSIGMEIISRTPGSGSVETNRALFNSTWTGNTSAADADAAMTVSDIMAAGAYADTTHFADGIHPALEGSQDILENDGPPGGLQAAINSIFVAASLAGQQFMLMGAGA